MKTHVYHGDNVWEVRDRAPTRVTHTLSGPSASVLALAQRIADMWPTVRVVSSVEEAQHLVLTLTRAAIPCGTSVAFEAPSKPFKTLTA